MSTGQRGVAIVLAMSVVALAAMAATALMITQSTWARQSELTAAHAQAQSVVQAGADWARAILNDDRRMSSVDHLGEPWALRLPTMSVEGGELDGYIQDQQGLFNLNNLVRGGKLNVAQFTQFQRLLSTLGLPAALAGTLADWLDADSEPQPQGGAEDDAYLASQSPHLAANRLLIDVAELAMVRGFDDGVRVRLRPFVCALPVFTPVNVNTAPAEVLVAIMDGLDLDGARDLVARRERAYFRDRNDFVRQLPKGVLVANESISFSSDYFIATLRVTIGGAQARGVALFARTVPGVWPTVVWRKTL
jgi:general secretion pathway protein K